MTEDVLGSLPPVLVYLLVATLVTVEVAVTAGLVLPAATALIALGLLANAGTVGIVPSIGVAIASAWLGGSIAYHSGRRLGPRTRTNRLSRWIGPKRWERADRLLARYGGRAVFVGQRDLGQLPAHAPSRSSAPALRPRFPPAPASRRSRANARGLISFPRAFALDPCRSP
ncbi:DedA family protein [Micromonospora sp. CPCC 206061]|uniref:DedA family protein n=1 Tax=Micromonospora sp. CPCC 206061 TaxID=3122410 RepID=UPI002FF094F0